MLEIRKVAHVMRRFVPDKWGGTEAVVFNLSEEFQREGVVSPIHCTAMFAEPGTGQVGSVRVSRHRYVLPWFGLSCEAKAQLRLKGGSPLSLPLFFSLLKEKELSLIHTHVQHRLGGMARTVAKLKGIPYVVSIHGGYFTLPGEQVEKMTEPFRGKLEWGKVFGALFGSRRVLADAAAIICVGQNEAEETRRRFPGKPVHYVPNGVDINRFAQADGALFRDRYGFRPDEKIVLCVSRIDYQKNQLGLVRAFARFAEGHPGHRLVLVGAVTVEAYGAELKSEIERLGIGDKVAVVGGMRPDDPLLPSAYQAAELFVLPSVHEPFGIVVLEAWAAGVPVVAGRVGGIPGFAVDHKNILFAGPANDAELAQRMAGLADDPSLRDRLAENAGREVRAKYGWDVAMRRTMEVYEQAVRGS